MKLAVTALISNQEGKILAVSRRDNPDAWGLPGGKVDAGETLEQAIIREVKEETGLDFLNVLPVFTRACLGETDYETTTFTGKVSGDIHTDEEGRIAWVKPLHLIQGPFGEYNMKLFSHLNSRGI